jgi:chitin synthase
VRISAVFCAGEDRWLCTLMLQQGYRVEYTAASNSYTKSPQTFREFFNQRRRWIPSTIINTADLIRSWRSTIHRNGDISFAYIFYQLVMLITAILGPGFILVMMAGATQLALSPLVDVHIAVMFAVNLIPVAIFVVLCFVTKPDTQVGETSRVRSYI